MRGKLTRWFDDQIRELRRPPLKRQRAITDNPECKVAARVQELEDLRAEAARLEGGAPPVGIAGNLMIENDASDLNRALLITGVTAAPNPDATCADDKVREGNCPWCGSNKRRYPGDGHLNHRCARCGGQWVPQEDPWYRKMEETFPTEPPWSEQHEQMLNIAEKRGSRSPEQIAKARAVLKASNDDV